MTDTPDFIARKQVEIVLSKPISQRLQLLNDTIEHGRQLARNRLLKQNPNLSPHELMGQLIREYYSDFFNATQLADIDHKLTERQIAD
jgi:hypothetical protein